MKFEYIRLRFDYDDLGPLNKLADAGWRVVHVEYIPFQRWHSENEDNYFALMERQLEVLTPRPLDSNPPRQQLRDKGFGESTQACIDANPTFKRCVGNCVHPNPTSHPAAREIMACTDCEGRSVDAGKTWMTLKEYQLNHCGPMKMTGQMTAAWHDAGYDCCPRCKRSGTFRVCPQGGYCSAKDCTYAY